MQQVNHLRLNYKINNIVNVVEQEYITYLRNT